MSAIVKDLILKNRSYRRFDQDQPIEESVLRELVDYARLSPCGTNKQALKYCISVDSTRNRDIFPTLSWAGYLKDWPGPVEGQRPTGYIVILGDKTISEYFGCNQGIAAQSILLGAVEKGLGGCMIGSIHRKRLSAVLDLPEKYEILLVIALGSPIETVVVDAVSNNDIRYWRDEQGVHHVPKRSLDDIIVP